MEELNTRIGELKEVIGKREASAKKYKDLVGSSPLHLASLYAPVHVHVRKKKYYLTKCRSGTPE